MADTRPRACVVLIGARGCGKSSVGRRVAAALGWVFVDTDDLVEQAAGRSIAAIFAAEGEAAFRAREAQALVEALDGARRVVAAGGGVVLSPENRARLERAGVCVWLTAPPEELHRRVQADPDSGSRRPALSTADGLAEMRQVLAARWSLYEAVADCVVDTAGRSVEAVAQEVLALVSARLAAAGER